MAEMQTQVEQLDDDRVRLTVDVPAGDVHHAVEHAASDLAASTRIPGFRKGKVPMPLLVQRIGRDRIYAEAVDSHIGSWFWNAAARSRVQPVEQPRYEYDLPSSDKQDWRFTAEFAVQPKPEPADWTQLEVPKPEIEVPEEVVQAHLDEEIENAIRGLGVGESREVVYELGEGSRRQATVTVNEIKEKVLPPLDDEVALATSEFSTLDELRRDLEQRIREQLEEEAEGQFRAAALDELVEATGVQPAGPLVEARTRELVTGLARSLQARGIDANTYLQVSGQTPELLEQRLRAEAAQSVARELVLEAVADKLGLDVSDDEIREELRTAGETDSDIDAFVAEGGADRVRDDLRMKKALDRIAAEVTPISPDLHEARESIWTPEQDRPAADTKLWTPASKE